MYSDAMSCSAARAISAGSCGSAIPVRACTHTACVCPPPLLLPAHIHWLLCVCVFVASQSEPERSASYNFGQFRLAGGTDNEIGEAWIQQHVKAMHDGFTSDGFAANEFFLLPRSSWAGLSQYSAGACCTSTNCVCGTVST